MRRRDITAFVIVLSMLMLFAQHAVPAAAGAQPSQCTSKTRGAYATPEWSTPEVTGTGGHFVNDTDGDGVGELVWFFTNGTDNNGYLRVYDLRDHLLQW